MTAQIRVFTSGLYMTTSGVVFGAEGALVIDPNLLPREIAMVQVYVEQSAKPAQYLVYTHHHWDHILGGQAFPSARRLAHRRLLEEVARNRAEEQICQFDAEYYVQRDPPFEFLPPHELVEDGWTGNLGDLEFRLIHLPGHAVDMVGVHVPAEKTLFAADMLSDVELPMIDGDGCDYLTSLRKVDEMVTARQIETLVPGHGHVTLGAETIRARIAEDIAYIDRLRMVVGGKLSEGEEAAIEACRSMGYRAKNGWPPMAKTHEANVKEVYRAMGGSCFLK